MVKTETQDTLGESRNAYCLLALLSSETRQELAILLKTLRHDLGDIVWTTPVQSLHITLCEIIQSKEYSEDKDRLYSMHSTEYENLTEIILENYKPITVSFDTIEVSPQAIIIRGRDNGSFEAIRSQLVSELPLPKETKMPPSIIHTTVARFRKEADVENVRDVVNKYSINISEQVCEFKLIHLHTTPLLNYDTIRTYQLGVK